MQEVLNPSIESAHIPETGADVERSAGDLFRIPNEAFITGLPLVIKESRRAPVLCSSVRAPTTRVSKGGFSAFNPTSNNREIARGLA